MTHRTKIFAAIAAAFITQASHANLVLNPGFETGNLDEWTVEEATNGSSITIFPGGITPGNWYSSFSASAGEHDAISQTLNTLTGVEYLITFWVYNLGIEDDNLQIQWEGNTVLDRGPVGTGLESWEEISLNVTATQDGSLLKFRLFDSQSAVGLDNIQVQAIPEPAAPLVLFGAGIAILATRKRTL